MRRPYRVKEIFLETPDSDLAVVVTYKGKHFGGYLPKMDLPRRRK